MTDWTDPEVNLHVRILAVMRDIKGLTPEGQIRFGTTNYRYISEKQLTTAVREKLIEYGITILPVSIEETTENKVTFQKVTYRLTNAFRPSEFMDVVSTGQGFDQGDKGSGKASTNAFKYLLFRVFEIPQSDDPDDTSSEQIARTMQPKTSTITHTPESVLRRRAEQQKPAGGVQR